MKLNLGKGLVIAGVLFGLTPYAVFADDAMTSESAPAATTTMTTETKTTEATTTTETAEPAKKAKKPAKKHSGKKHHHKKKKHKHCEESAEPVSSLESQDKTAAAEPNSSELGAAPTATE